MNSLAFFTSASYRQVRSLHFREVTKMVDISLATVANSATVPSILPRSAKWQYLYFDRGGG
nr:MAG TPA: hypothetical protein [Caudoviricetes sp.]